MESILEEEKSYLSFNQRPQLIKNTHLGTVVDFYDEDEIPIDL